MMLIITVLIFIIPFSTEIYHLGFFGHYPTLNWDFIPLCSLSRSGGSDLQGSFTLQRPCALQASQASRAELSGSLPALMPCPVLQAVGTHSLREGSQVVSGTADCSDCCSRDPGLCLSRAPPPAWASPGIFYSPSFPSTLRGTTWALLLLSPHSAPESDCCIEEGFYYHNS